jgi:lipopolysaccharide export LptBFGC system permease protein LptF
VPKQGPVISTTQQTQNNTKTLDFVYTDNASKTSDITVRVENARNSSEVFDIGSDSGDISQFKFTTTVSGDNVDKQLVANYTYVHDGQQEQATQPYGSNTYPVLTELDQGWASIFGVGFLIISGSLFSVRNARIGALVIPGIGLMLNLVGILDGVVTLASVGLAFSIGIGVNLISNGFLE